MRKKTVTNLSKEQALNRASSLCSGSEHCTTQIEEKLLSWGISAKDADDIVSHLIDENFIDNLRFAKAYCHDKFYYNRWGRIKIGMMLRHLRLSEEEIAEGMTAIPEEAYLQTIDEVLRGKDRTLHDTDNYLRKGKLVRHLLSHGFEMELVLNAVDAYIGQR